MEQAILALLGISITLTLYLDRGRRADLAQLRTETNEGFAQLRSEVHDGLKEVRAENAKLRDDMNQGFKQVHTRIDKLTDTVMDLCRRVGRLEGRAEASQPKPDTAP